jgi:hypothetical protein
VGGWGKRAAARGRWVSASFPAILHFLAGEKVMLVVESILCRRMLYLRDGRQEVVAARKLLLLLQHASKVAFSIIILQSPLLLERNDNEREILVMHYQYEY